MVQVSMYFCKCLLGAPGKASTIKIYNKFWNMILWSKRILLNCKVAENAFFMHFLPMSLSAFAPYIQYALSLFTPPSVNLTVKGHISSEDGKITN